MDRIIFGDNQFFGINHMSEKKAQEQAERFRNINAIIEVVDMAYDCGIHSFMFNSHDKVSEICDHFRAHPDRYQDLRLYPSIPYAHKYANAVAEKGLLGALRDMIVSRSTAKQMIMTIGNLGGAVFSRDVFDVMKLLIDAEMKAFHGLNLKVIFLQNIATDLLLGTGLKNVFIEFADYIERRYKPAEPGFTTANLPMLVDLLLKCGIKNPIVCSPINKIGYFMNPNKDSCEETIRTKPFRSMAMSILASGAVPASEAVRYVSEQRNIKSIVYGASSRHHIVQTKELIEKYSTKDE